MFFNGSISNRLRLTTTSHTFNTKSVIITPNYIFLPVSKMEICISFCIRMPMPNDNLDKFVNIIEL